jgi:hypothetical protein
MAEARATFEQMGASSWTAETVARIAEGLEFAGRHKEALVAADAALAIESEAATGGIIPMLERTRGRALSHLGRREDARSALERSAERATADRADLELALTLNELARLPDTTSQDASIAASRAEEIAARMGVLLDVVSPRDQE